MCFDEADNFFGVAFVCGVSEILEAVSPGFVVRSGEFKKRCVSRSVHQEVGMVEVRFHDRVVRPEAAFYQFPSVVEVVVFVVVSISCPPAFTLDTEVVVGFLGQGAGSGL